MIRIAILIMGLSLLVGCELEDKNEPGMETVIDIGHFTLDSTTLIDFPYQEDSTYLYFDSLGTRLNLFLEKGRMTDAIEKQILVEQANGDLITYSFTNEVQEYTLKNDSFFFKFYLQISARPYAPDPASMAVADVLDVFVENSIGQRERVFTRELNLRSWPMSFQGPAMNQVEILGKIFNNVYSTDDEEALYIIRYTDDRGIISFIDFLNIQYCIQ